MYGLKPVPFKMIRYRKLIQYQEADPIQKGEASSHELCEEAPVVGLTEQVDPSGLGRPGLGDLRYWTTTVKVELDCTDPEEPARPGAGVAVIVAVDVTD